MSEAALWALTSKKLGRYGWLGRLENSVESGWPDVAYTLKVPSRPAAPGWLELKHKANAPKHPQGVVVLKHLTLEQVQFIECQAALGARAHVLFQLGRVYLLLNAVTTRRLYERELTRWDLLNEAEVLGLNKFPTRELVAHLTKPLER